MTNVAAERDAFEAWYAQRHQKPTHENSTRAHCAKMDDWEVWQARARTAPALESPAAPANDLALIVAALEHSQPQMAHYAEPRERHAQALAAARRLAAAPQAPAAPVGLPAQGDPAALLQLAELLESGRSLINTERKEAADALRLQATAAKAAPAAPAVDATSDTALLDAMQRHRIALVPEFEGPWDAEIYNDDAEAHPIASGNTPREALRAAIAAQAKEGGEAC